MKSQSFLNQRDGIRLEPRGRTIEEVYDDVSYVVKEQAGLPTRYFMLTPDQVYFLENFTNLLDKPDVNELLCARDLMTEALESINQVIKKEV